MIRFLAGGLSALLLVAAGVFLGISHAQNEEIVPPAPAPQAAATAEKPLPAAPSAEKSREEKRFDRYDKDRDELVTRVEMMETRRKPFEKLDANRDGNLSFEEWAVATSEKFGKADADRSGTLSRTEFATTRRETVPKKCAC